jgi:hypothetical protein
MEAELVVTTPKNSHNHFFRFPTPTVVFLPEVEVTVAAVLVALLS